MLLLLLLLLLLRTVCVIVLTEAHGDVDVQCNCSVVDSRAADLPQLLLPRHAMSTRSLCGSARRRLQHLRDQQSRRVPQPDPQPSGDSAAANLSLVFISELSVGYILLHTHKPFNSLWSWTSRVGRYQRKHSPTHSHPEHRTSFINFLHGILFDSVYVPDSPF